jgi:hypothetical protein
MPHADMHARFRPGYIARFLSAALLLSGAALADDTGLARCRAIADSAARLACYDALPLPGPEAKSGAPGAPASAAAPGPRFKAEEFGLEEQIITRTGVPQIDSRVAGKFNGWAPNRIIRLENGQVWQVSDIDSRFYDLDSPKVTITRGALGAFYFNVDGDNHTVRVRRVQ